MSILTWLSNAFKRRPAGQDPRSGKPADGPAIPANAPANDPKVPGACGVAKRTQPVEGQPPKHPEPKRGDKSQPDSGFDEPLQP